MQALIARIMGLQHQPATTKESPFNIRVQHSVALVLDMCPVDCSCQIINALLKTILVSRLACSHTVIVNIVQAFTDLTASIPIICFIVL